MGDMTTDTESIEHPLRGHVVEWYAPMSSTATGIVSNVPPVRRIGRVNHARPDGWLVVFDHDGIRAVVNPNDVHDLGRADAGWSNLR